MKLPETVLCEKCGSDSAVLTSEFDEKLMAGDLPADDPRRTDGFVFKIECPRCGVRSQYLAPPP